MPDEDRGDPDMNAPTPEAIAATLIDKELILAGIDALDAKDWPDSDDNDEMSDEEWRSDPVRHEIVRTVFVAMMAVLIRREKAE